MVIGLLNSLLVTAISIFRTQDDLIVLSIAIFFHVRTINKICAFFKTYLICIHAGTVTNEESLFAVSNRTKRQSGSDPSIIPILFEDLNFTDTQRDFCEDSPSCLYDLVVTEDGDIAQFTLEEEKDANATVAELGKLYMYVRICIHIS